MHWLGFHDAASSALSDILKRSTSNFDSIRILENVEPSFDETDELALKCSHYTVAEGRNHSSVKSLHRLHNFSQPVTFNNRRPRLPVKARPCPRNLQRSGHICSFIGKTCSQVADNVAVMGGLHVSEGRDNLVFAAAAAFPKSSGFLYVFGGRSSPFHPSSTLRVENLSNGDKKEILSTGKDLPLDSGSSLLWLNNLRLLLGGNYKARQGNPEQRYEWIRHPVKAIYDPHRDGSTLSARRNLITLVIYW